MVYREPIRRPALRARSLEKVDSVKAGAMLDRTFVVSSGLLLAGVTVVCRQIPFGGAPLDLLGSDRDGQRVVRESHWS